MQPHPPLVLASRSPRRAALLRMLGLSFEELPADLDESYRAGETPAGHAERLAVEKALLISRVRTDAVVIGADTVVAADGDVLGKPRDDDDALRMLLRLQGRTHEVATGLAVVRAGVVHAAVEQVRVRFRAFGEDVARAYVATGEPADKAGAYGIQGAGGTLVEAIAGDYFAVVGLPLSRLILLLQAAGLRYNFRGLERAGEWPT